MAFCESYGVGKKVSELHDMAFVNRGWGSETEFGDMVAVGEKVWELRDMELDSGKPLTEIGGDMACRGSVVCKRVGQFRGMEFKEETKKPKLTTDGLEVVQAEEYEDNGVSPMVIYDGYSNTDAPDQFFTDLALLALNSFMKRNCLREGRLVKLVKVTSVVIKGVMLTLTMIADLKGNCDPEFDTDDPTLEAGILYRGSLVETEDFHVLYVNVCCSHYIPKEETDKVLAEYKFNDSDSDSDWDEGEEPDPSLTSEQFVTQLAQVAITTFNAHYPHMPYQFLGLLEFKASPGYFINYTITMTAKPKPPHDAKTDAPPVQTFLAIMSYQGGLPTEATVQGMIIVDPLQAS